jgi:hypothetical protein
MCLKYTQKLSMYTMMNTTREEYVISLDSDEHFKYLESQSVQHPLLKKTQYGHFVTNFVPPCIRA